MSSLEYGSLSRIQKAAALLILLGPEGAAEVLRHLDSEQIEAICHAMADLQPLDPEIQRRVLEEFGQLIAKGLCTKHGGLGYVESVLSISKDKPTASRILNRMTGGSMPNQAGELLKQMDARQILSVLKNEAPQAVAFILSCVDAAKAAQVLMLLPETLREEVFERLGSLEPISKEVAAKILANLGHHYDIHAADSGVYRGGGVENVADILKKLQKEPRKQVLSRLEERNPMLGTAVRKRVFGFEDLVRVQKNDLQRLMRDVDMADLALALKNANPALLAAVSGAISKRAAEGLREEMELLGQVKAKAIEAAQDRIVQAALKLEEAEEISLEAETEENAIV